jgi:hypothetical protein
MASPFSTPEDENHTTLSPRATSSNSANTTSATGSTSNQENIKKGNKGENPMTKSSSSSTVQSRVGPEKSKRPKDTSFHQQKMPAVQPIMSPRAVIPTLLILGIIFVPLGIIQLVVSNKTQEYVFDYTDCIRQAPSDAFAKPSNVGDSAVDWEWKKEGTDKCQIRFKLEKEIAGPVFMYYRLTNFYQNNRLYSRSISYKQLAGKPQSFEKLRDDCYPLIGPENEFDNNGKPAVYYPCGLIANSLFTDTISGLHQEGPAGGPEVWYSFPDKDISWKSDNVFVKPSRYSLDQVRAPPYWRNKTKYGVDPKTGKYLNQLPDLGLDERFLNWIRLSALPTFRKLYGKCTASIPPGTYTVTITNNYTEVDKFNGRKAVIISESSFLGGRSNFLGIAYLVVGSILMALGIAFLIKQMITPRTMGDVRYLPWYENID